MMDSNALEPIVDRLQASYIAALDGKDMKAWLALFSTEEDSSYTCTSAENLDAQLPVALMLDDNYARIVDRVTFIEKVWAGTFQDYRTRHFIERLSIEPSGTDTYKVRTNFHIMFTPEEAGDSRPLVCGEYRDVVQVRDGVAKFRHKLAVTDTIVLPRYVVYPV